MPVLSPHRSSSSGLSGSYRSTFSSSALERPFYGSSSYTPRFTSYSERYTTRTYTDSDGRRIYSRSGSINEDGVTTRFREESREPSIKRDSISRDSGISSIRENSISDYSRRDSSLTRGDRLSTANVIDSVAELRNKYSPANYVPACMRKNENIARSKSNNDIGLPPLELKASKKKSNSKLEVNEEAELKNGSEVDRNGVTEETRSGHSLSKNNSRVNNFSSYISISTKDFQRGDDTQQEQKDISKNDMDNKEYISKVIQTNDLSTSPKLTKTAISPSNSIANNSINSNSLSLRSSERDSNRIRDYSDDDSSGERALNNYSTIRSFEGVPQKSLGLNGLKNIGNTCFMNSVIQCLSNTRWLLEYLKKDAYIRDINTSISSMKGALIKAFAEVIKELWSEDGSDRVVNTASLKSQIQRFAPRFMGYAQQDAQEFLRYLLEGLHEDVNRVQEKPKPILTEIDEKLSDSEKAQESWLRYLRMDNSKIVDNFVGQLKSTLKCTHCGHCSVTFDPFWDLSLPIPQRTGQLRLSQCLDSFTREETLDGDEKPTCSKCKERRRCTKSFSIHKFPKILVIHLKRFSPTERFRGKLNVTVDFPIEGLDMSHYAADNVAPCRYNLYAISNHSGTTYSGHYTAYCRHPYTGQWHEYNDSRVSSISSKSLVSGEAYVLFYEQEGTKSHL
ncbi:ubiquitin carboxyl-terminal hydrolase 2-like isoform X2 [Diorhabda carinulata]|uniref:ubiquitin carboxyl-terminal hydrolase 2-like isoform X2 n=1 Tax=Diorhabda sublineata TaxID=1163346 RepID=UPI0024E04C5A|nr:ubiquitin carboxyl-terminal hydrolase 2-like isoform X2 [Diorhabda sublineata]XP_057659007.1 ubiquitin carboxyl-terminal hydrolase 2-like isoform X2 [Diorhabda carinulata]